MHVILRDFSSSPPFQPLIVESSQNQTTLCLDTTRTCLKYRMVAIFLTVRRPEVQFPGRTWEAKGPFQEEDACPSERHSPCTHRRWNGAFAKQAAQCQGTEQARAPKKPIFINGLLIQTVDLDEA